ncbi:MAG: magnesium chelatase ATPase subunit I [Anaerolineales bacterium]|nr:magnesium chelatase ATPase subunit I [Anaerolineales bacterium]
MTTPTAAPIYPFTAIVGQDEMKRALLLNAVDPGIGGVMIMGHRGTAKSTAVRALAALLPPIAPHQTHAEILVQGVRAEVPLFPLEESAAGSAPAAAPVPFIDLPLGATEDRVAGTLDIEAALTRGVKVFEPGLLARAHGGFLYIDEVNLLEDHLVDLLLDVAASGVNVVEREGLSVRHPARFVLVGSGNPEEGDLRPQLLDRFGLHAHIVTLTDVEQRVDIVTRAEAFRADPVAFLAAWEGQQSALREQITSARAGLPQTELPHALLLRAAQLCLKLGVDGHRGEITIARAARAQAALDGRREVNADEVRAVAVMSLRHRLRRDPLEEIDTGVKIEQAMEGIM